MSCLLLLLTQEICRGRSDGNSISSLLEQLSMGMVVLIGCVAFVVFDAYLYGSGKIIFM